MSKLENLPGRAILEGCAGNAGVFLAVTVRCHPAKHHRTHPACAGLASSNQPNPTAVRTYKLSALDYFIPA